MQLHISLSVNVINTRTCVSCIIITRLSGCFRPIFTLRRRFPYNSYANRATLLVPSTIDRSTPHTNRCDSTRAQNHNVSVKKLMNSNYISMLRSRIAIVREHTLIPEVGVQWKCGVTVYFPRRNAPPKLSSLLLLLLLPPVCSWMTLARGRYPTNVVQVK
jgi:hypothetical protein